MKNLLNNKRCVERKKPLKESLSARPMKEALAQHIKDSRGYIADNQGEEGMDGLRV